LSTDPALPSWCLIFSKAKFSVCRLCPFSQSSFFIFNPNEHSRSTCSFLSLFFCPLGSDTRYRPLRLYLLSLIPLNLFSLRETLGSAAPPRTIREQEYNLLLDPLCPRAPLLQLFVPPPLCPSVLRREIIYLRKMQYQRFRPAARVRKHTSPFSLVSSNYLLLSAGFPPQSPPGHFSLQFIFLLQFFTLVFFFPPPILRLRNAPGCTRLSARCSPR